MKKFIIPLLTAAVVVSMILTGCVPKAAPAPTPAAPTPAAPTPAPAEASLEEQYQRLVVDKGLAIPGLPLNPYAGGLATKPDGTPYVIGHPWPVFGFDQIVNIAELHKSYMTRGGGDFFVYNCQFSEDLEIAWLEDQITTPSVDMVIITCVDEYMVVPAVEAVMESGIPVLAQDAVIHSDKLLGWMGSDFAGPSGCNCLGEYLVEYVEATGEDLYVLTPWHSYSWEMMQMRHRGFEMGIADNPKIHLVDPGVEHLGSDTTFQDIVMDQFSADPKLNAVWADGGGTTGCLEGLRAMGKLKPIGDPDHIVVVFTDFDTLTAELMREKLVDVATTHAALHYSDVGIKIALNYLVLGEPPPTYTVVTPMVAITPDNMDTLKLFGCTPLYPLLPQGQWELWPVLDTTLPGLLSGGPEYKPITIETPTVAKRMEEMGY